jgi:outer membrane protein
VEEHNQNALTKAAELRMVQAEITLDNDRAQLAQTLLIDPLEVFEVVKPEWDPNLIGTEQLSINNLVETAKTSRSDYLRAEKNEMAARYGLAAQRGQLAPNLSAFVSVGSSYNFQHDVPDSVRDDSGSLVLNPFKPRPFAEQFRTNNVYKAYGLQLTIPIVTGFRTRTSVTQQRVQYRNNQLVRRNLEYQIRSDVFRAVKTFEGTKKAYAVTVAQLEAANTAFLLESERYNLGVTNFVDYTNANRALVQAQTDKAQAEYRLVFQKILVDYAVGTLKPEDIIQE